MPRAMRSFLAAAIPLTALLVSGCSALSPGGSSAVALEEPVVQPDPCVATEATTLQRYQEMSQQYEAEKARSAALAGELAAQKDAREKAEQENDGLRRQVEQLSAKAAELDALKKKFDEAQKSAFEVENALRETRRELLEERLAGVKREETIVALKIERAKDLRKSPAERALQSAAERPSESAAPERPAPQNAPDSGRKTVVNP